MTEQSSGARVFPNFELCSAVTVTLKACLHSRSGEVEHTLAGAEAGTILAESGILFVLCSLVTTDDVRFTLR